MRIVSVTENLKEEKRVAITPETTKKYLSLGFEVLLSENYAEHLGIKDDEYSKLGAKILKIPKIIFTISNSLSSKRNFDISLFNIKSLCPLL